MKIILQRVTKASVRVGGEIVGSIDKGFLVLAGVCNADTKENAKQLAKKIYKLRVFEDEQGKVNLSAADVNAAVLVVSQFTLYADCKKGNRPSFVSAGGAQHAKEIIDCFIDECLLFFNNVQSGIFGAKMEVELVNDGPFTLVVES